LIFFFRCFGFGPRHRATGHRKHRFFLSLGSPTTHRQRFRKRAIGFAGLFSIESPLDLSFRLFLPECKPLLVPGHPVLPRGDKDDHKYLTATTFGPPDYSSLRSALEHACEPPVKRTCFASRSPTMSPTAKMLRAFACLPPI